MKEYNLTEKLAFNEDPVLVIKDVKVTVDSDAETVLKIMDVLENEGEAKAIRKCLSMLLNEEDQKKVKALKLKMDDYTEVVMTAIALAMGEDPAEIDTGEQ